MLFLLSPVQYGTDSDYDEPDNEPFEDSGSEYVPSSVASSDCTENAKLQCFTFEALLVYVSTYFLILLCKKINNPFICRQS